MEIFIFVIGVILFLGAGSIVVYWIASRYPENYFYRSFGCLSGMSLLTVAFKLWGHHSFLPDTQKWILLSASILLLLVIAFYFIGYIITDLGANGFEARLLLMGIPALVEIYLIFASFNDFKIFSFLTDATGPIITVVAVVASSISLLISRSRLKETEIKLRTYRKKIGIDITESSIIFKSSRADRIKLERAVLRIYTLLQEEQMSPSRAYEHLIKYETQRDLANTIMDRIFGTNLYRTASSISLLEFAQEVLPEYYRAEKYSRSNFRNSSMDMRMLEDLYDRFRRLLNSEQGGITEIKQRIEDLYKVVTIKKTEDVGSVKRDIVDETSCQNQIRELFHALEAPLATTEMAIRNLHASFSALDDEQIKKLAKIQNNIKLIKSVLYAYRELTFMNIRNSESAFLPLPTIIHSIKDFLECEPDITITVDGFPDEIPYYSTNLITILILPLLQNAIESTPKNRKIGVSYIDSKDYHVIKVKNHCTRLPSLSNLETEGYSSKGNSHEGKGISIVKRVSNTVGIKFALSVNNNQVIANLELPKKNQQEV